MKYHNILIVFDPRFRRNRILRFSVFVTLTKAGVQLFNRKIMSSCKQESNRIGITEKILKVSLFYISLLFLITSCGPIIPINKPYFWKAEKNGKTSYFLGTIHNGISLDELFCSDVILTKLKNSDLVFTELGHWKGTPQQKQWTKTLYHSPDGEDFNRLSPESQRFLEQNGINRELSYYALVFAVEDLCMKEAVGEEAAQVSLDRKVMAIALHLNIPLQALDTLKLRKPMAKLDTKETIERRIQNYHWCPRIMRAMITSYKMGIPAPYKTKGLARWIENHYSTDEFDKWLLKHRNEKWFTQFKEAHKNHDRIFVAAGNAHFTDAFNVIDMLKRDGFDVERVSCPNSF